MTAPVGAIVKLYVDLAADVDPGHWIRTEAGRIYDVVSSRRQERGMHVGRQHLLCVVIGRVEDEQLARNACPSTMHTIRWYKRPRRRR